MLIKKQNVSILFGFHRYKLFTCIFYPYQNLFEVLAINFLFNFYFSFSVLYRSSPWWCRKRSFAPKNMHIVNVSFSYVLFYSMSIIFFYSITKHSKSIICNQVAKITNNTLAMLVDNIKGIRNKKLISQIQHYMLLDSIPQKKQYPPRISLFSSCRGVMWIEQVHNYPHQYLIRNNYVLIQDEIKVNCILNKLLSRQINTSSFLFYPTLWIL